MTTLSVSAKIAQYQQLIVGLQKNASNLVLTMSSETYTTMQVVTILQSLVTANSSVISSKSAWHDAIAASTKLEAQYAPLVKVLVETVDSMYGNAEGTLATFGLAPKKPRKPLSTEALAVRKLKAAATRKARGTASKKQKAIVTGNVVGVTLVPTIAPSATPTALAPVAPATSPAATPPVVSATTSGASPAVTPTTHS